MRLAPSFNRSPLSPRGKGVGGEGASVRAAPKNQVRPCATLPLSERGGQGGRSQPPPARNRAVIGVTPSSSAARSIETAHGWDRCNGSRGSPQLPCRISRIGTCPLFWAFRPHGFGELLRPRIEFAGSSLFLQRESGSAFHVFRLRARIAPRRLDFGAP